MEIQRLTVEEGARLRAIRLCALRDAPNSFGTTFEESAMWPPEVWAKQLAGIAAFVAVGGDSDVGLVRGVPDGRAKDTARLSSLWVAPEARSTGVGACLSMPLSSGRVPMDLANFSWVSTMTKYQRSRSTPVKASNRTVRWVPYRPRGNTSVNTNGS